MCIRETPYCPDCEPQTASVPVPQTFPGPKTASDSARNSFGTQGRRAFMRVAGGAAALVGLCGHTATNPAHGADAKPNADATKPRAPKPAEELIKELYAGLNDKQKTQLVMPWDHGADKGTATRLGMYNRPLNKTRIGDNYTKPQQELVQRILKSICSDEEGYRRISRNNTWDSSKTFDSCAAHIFGDPTGDKKFAWLFTGHHLTVRCDGNSMPGAAFGGPLYYGHIVPGYSKKNVFNYQTQSVISAFEALDEKQRKAALVIGSPGERAKSVRFRSSDQATPGIAMTALSKDQQKLVQKVMRDALGMFRKEDGDEVMQIIKTNGGMEKIHLGFYKEEAADEEWQFWRLEGPGFVWNYRVTPHVHCFVNISSAYEKKAAKGA
jgi:hypothetical protein